MNLLNSVSTFLVLCLLSLTAQAEQSVIPMFPRGEIQYQELLTGGEHAFLLSTPKRISNALSIESEQRVKGDRRNILFRIDEGANSEKAFRFYQRYFSQHGEALYQCEQRACGNSNYWANRIFGERKLLGRDSNQYYIVGKVAVGSDMYWLSVYSVVNGRKQHFVYLSTVQIPASSSSTDSPAQ